MVSTRRSARSSCGEPVPPPEGGAPSDPNSGAAPSTVFRRRSREASPPQSPGPAREIGGLHTVLVIPDDKILKQPAEVEKKGWKGKKILVEGPDELDVDDESLEEPPGWLPDGWIMEAHCADNGSIHRYYTSPISGYTFSSKVETLHYLFSGMDERFLESQACAEDNELHKSHAWLPGGWVIEVRAGGKKMDKMYKFYAHLPTGKRFLSKRDVLAYVNEGKISRSDMDVLCDTSTDNNILAHLEFNPDGLPDGWVKELIFRKCNDGIRKDPYYTDPISHHVFRTLRSVLSYLKSGEISRHAYMPRRNVTDMYSFDICADLPQSMLKRLGLEGQSKQKSLTTPVLHKEPSGETSNHSKGDTSAGLPPQSDPKGDKHKTVESACTKSSNTNKRQRDSPKRSSKQTEENTSECDMSSHKEAKQTDLKIEMDMINEEEMPNRNTLEYTPMEGHTTIIQQADNNLGPDLLTKKQNQETFSASQLHEQENDKFRETSKKVTCSTVQKFYMRRGGSQALGLKKG